MEFFDLEASSKVAWGEYPVATKNNRCQEFWSYTSCSSSPSGTKQKLQMQSKLAF